MWDVLADAMGATRDEATWVELADAVAADRVDAALMARVEAELNAHGRRHFELRLIPYGFEEGVQVNILQTLAEGLGRPDDRLYLDITHGLRHLPMLGLLSAFYLQALGHARVDEIFYGALDRGGAAGTPVVSLRGLLKVQDWVRCLEQFEKDGDYGIFRDLLVAEGLAGKLLAEAAFLERVGNLSLAQKKLNSFWQGAAAPASPTGRMFFPLLKARLAWRTSARRSEWERKLAEQALAKADYLRASIFAFESRISARVERDGGDTNNFQQDREAAERALEQETWDARVDCKSERSFRTLKYLRNQLAHGVRANVDAQGITRLTAEFVVSLAGDEDKLRPWLAAALRG
jgi:CRISPR-associated Csx2 family protein